MGSAEGSLFAILNKALAVDIRLRAILQGYREKGLFWFSLDGEQSLSPISLKASDPGGCDTTYFTLWAIFGIRNTLFATRP